MPAVDIFVAAIVAATAFLTIIGLAYRRRFRACILFPLYLLSAGTGALLVLAWPDVFWTWRFWLVSSTLQALLSTGMAVEIALKTLRPPLNAGRRRMRRILFIIGVGTLLSLFAFPWPGQTAFEWTLLVEHLYYGTGWMFGAFLIVVWYYGVPTDRLHRDIAAVACPLFTVVVFYRESLYKLDPWFGLGEAAGRDLISKTLYALAMAYWVVCAWRRDDPVRYPPELEKLLQPWRVPR